VGKESTKVEYSFSNQQWIQIKKGENQMTYQDEKAMYDAWFEENFDRHVDELAEFVSIPTIGAEPEHAEDMQRGGQWLADKLTRIGMENATVHPTATGHPVVTAEWLHAEGQPTVLVYGHFDVQPVTGQPWDTDPFAPVIEGNRLYGRGATDCKGGLYMAVTAAEALLANDGRLPVNLKFFFEGQEEIGSPSLMPWIGANAKWLATDYAYNADAMNYSDEQGLMWKGLRGGAFVAFTVKGANRVLHSGIYGGIAPNANVAMSRIVTSFHNEDGTVAVEGFYDNVDPLTDLEKQELAARPWDAEADREMFGIKEWVGEAGYTPMEIRHLRPTLEVVGQHGGIDGLSAVVPNEARGYILCRLVTSQMPTEINNKVQAHIEKHLPAGFTVGFNTVLSITPGIKFREDDPAFQIARSVLTDVYGQEPMIGYVGGGVPVLAYMRYLTGRDLTTFGFQREDENFHSANEFLRLSDFKIGERAYAQLLYAHVGQPLREAHPLLEMDELGQFHPVHPEGAADGHCAH
jgi:acetylornithine deacetylase/succinyl-diaminopimelate desuccinylase-like protein